MLREVSEKEALKAYQEGEVVFLIKDASNPYPMVYNMAQLFEGKRFVVDEKEDVPNSEPKPETVPEDKEDSKSSKKKDIDTGKIIALHNAGWSYRKIAEEMGLTLTTVSKYVNQYYQNQEKQEE